jgi:hypothetical protein
MLIASLTNLHAPETLDSKRHPRLTSVQWMTLVLVAVTMMVTATMVMVMVVKKPHQATVASHQHRSLP